MKANFIFGMLLTLFVLGGCSSPPPSDRFLNSTLALLPADGKGDPEVLHLRATDLYNIFDLHVTKKWQRVHENSWKMVINGKDPATHRTSRMVITLATDPKADRTVIVKSITEAGKEYPPNMIAEMIRQLDQSFIPKKQ